MLCLDLKKLNTNIKRLSTFQTCPLWQRSPTFLAPGTSFVEDNFSTDPGGGMVLG